MRADLRDPADLDTLKQLVRVEADAKQRDRYRVVLIAIEGVDGVEQERPQIASITGRSRQFVDAWVGRYRQGGIDQLKPIKQPGRQAYLSKRQQEELRRLLDQGPVEGVDGRSVFFGQDIRALIERHFGKTYALSGVYELLKRMNYSWLCPRPRNPQGDPALQEAFKKRSSMTSTP